MAGGIGLGQALQLISGVPLRKVATAKFENLHLPKRLEGGGGGGFLKGILQDGNLSSIMSNPMGALTGQLQGGIGQAAQQIQGMIGGGPAQAIQALTGSGGLSTIVSQFTAAGDHLAGVSNGGQGFTAFQGHEQLVAMLGDDTPEHLSLDVVAGPHEAEDLIQSILDALPVLAAQLAAGEITVAGFVAWVEARAAEIDAVTQASADALAEGQAKMAAVSGVFSVAGGLMSYPGDGGASPFQARLRRMVKPEPLAAMDAAAGADRQAARDAAARDAPRDIDKITSLEG